jgi:AcrR family transcriptional regulator
MTSSIIETHSVRQEQIYEVASALFSRRGYHSTSVRDIARELDLQGGSLYAHIASKEDVLWEIITRTAAAFNAALAPILAEELTIVERLRRMIHAHVSVVVGQSSHAAVYFQDWRHLSEPRLSQVRELRDAYEARFRATIADGMTDGTFAAREPKLATIFLLTALNALPGWYDPAGPRGAEEIAEEFARLAIDGLCSPENQT